MVWSSFIGPELGPVDRAHLCKAHINLKPRTYSVYSLYCYGPEQLSMGYIIAHNLRFGPGPGPVEGRKLLRTNAFPWIRPILSGISAHESSQDVG